MICPSKIIQHWFPCLSFNISIQTEEVIMHEVSSPLRCPCLCLSSPFHQGSMDRICYAEERESSSGLPAVVKPWSDVQGHRILFEDQSERIAHMSVDFASILYFRWFSRSCYIWQHSLLAFDKQLLPNVSKETCQMLQLRFNCGKKNAV